MNHTLALAHSPTHTRRERGLAILILVIILALGTAVTFGTLSASKDDALVASLRAETTQAFYAAESAQLAALKLLKMGEALPASGASITIGTSRATYQAVPSGTTGSITVDGYSGDARRRIRITVQ
jgi:uncharacterized protein (UPF0333 family)